MKRSKTLRTSFYHLWIEAKPSWHHFISTKKQKRNFLTLAATQNSWINCVASPSLANNTKQLTDKLYISQLFSVASQGKAFSQLFWVGTRKGYSSAVLCLTSQGKARNTQKNETKQLTNNLSFARNSWLIAFPWPISGWIMTAIIFGSKAV